MRFWVYNSSLMTIWWDDYARLKTRDVLLVEL